MQAVLYVGHGSRVRQGVLEAIQFIEQCKPSIEVPIQELCFLELAQPTIQEGIDLCVKQGATSIAVVPLLLLSAAHAKVDIPAEIAKSIIQHPHLHMTYSQAFGVHQHYRYLLIASGNSSRPFPLIHPSY